MASSTRRSSADAVHRLEPELGGDRGRVRAAPLGDLSEHLLRLRRGQRLRLHAATSGASAGGRTTPAPSTARSCSTWVSTRPGSPPASMRGQRQAVVAAGDRDTTAAIRRRRRRRASRRARPALAGSGGRSRSSSATIAAVGLERHEVGLREVAVVLGLLLAAPGCGAARGLVPVAGLLDAPARPPRSGRPAGAPRTRWRDPATAAS